MTIDEMLWSFKTTLRLQNDLMEYGIAKATEGTTVYLKTPAIDRAPFPQDKSLLLFQKLGKLFLPPEIDGEKVAWIFLNSDAPYPNNVTTVDLVKTAHIKVGQANFDKKVLNQGLNRLGQVAAGAIAAGTAAVLTFNVTRRLVRKLFGGQ